MLYERTRRNETEKENEASIWPREKKRREGYKERASSFVVRRSSFFASHLPLLLLLLPLLLLSSTSHSNSAPTAAETSTTAASSSSSSSSSSLLRKDPRPLSDKAFQQQLAATVRSCLLRHGYTATPLGPKTLASPTTKEFSAIALFLFRLVDPTTAAFRKLEDDVALGFRRLKYPVAFSKCALFSVGSSSTWPGLLGALAWLADLVEYIDRAVSRESCCLELFAGGNERRERKR